MKGSKLKMYKRFEFRMFWVYFDSVEPKVLHVLCHCYAAINIIIKIFKVIITFSYIGELARRVFRKKWGKVRKAVSFLYAVFVRERFLSYMLFLSGNPLVLKKSRKEIVRTEDNLV